MRHTRFLLTLWIPLLATLLPSDVSAGGSWLQSQRQVTLDVVMARAVEAVAEFERNFAAVVAEEHLVQRAGTRTVIDSRREMRSDFMLVRRPREERWLPFRDVFEVDGRAVRDRNERLQKLFVDTPQTALSDAARISNESSRYNLGSVIRTINVPTFGLILLRPSYMRGFEFTKRGEQKVGDAIVWRVAFVERARPTIVRTLRGDDVPIEGSLWIEPTSGRVVKTLVKTVGTPDPDSPSVNYSAATLMWVEVTFAPSDAFGLWVPATMREWGRDSNSALVFGTATYSKVRRFTVRTTETFGQSADPAH